MNNNKSAKQNKAQQIQFMTGLIKRVSQPMIVTLADRRLLHWNAAFSKLTGYNDKELGDPIISAGLTAPEWHESETKAFERLQRTSKSQIFQKEYIRKDGSRVPVEVLVYQLSEDNGKVQYYIGLITDITERKQLEEALQKSERHYRILVENAIEGIVVIQEEEIKFVNPIVAIATGYSREELQSMSLRELLCPDNEKAAVESISQAVVPGTLLVVPLLKIRTKVGEIRLIEATIISIIWDDKPANLNLIRDITGRNQAEETLRQSEEKYRTILEDAKEGYWETDLAGNFTSFNDAICRLLGHSKKDMMGMNYRAYTSTEDVNKVYKSFNQVYRTGKSIRTMYYEIVRKEGTKRFAETSVFPRRNDKEEIIGFRGVTRDITERKNMEEELRQSEERYRTILDEMQDSYFEVDLAGNCTFANDANGRNLGYPKEELIGINYRVYTAAEDVDKVYQCFNQAYLTGQPSRAITFKVVRKDGGIGQAELSAFPLRNEKGEIIGFRGIGRDIAERMKMEEALRHSEEKYRSILETIEESYYEVDLAGNFTFVNDTLCRQFGYSREELMGMNYKVYTPTKICKKVFETYNLVYRTGKPIKWFPMEQIRKDGTRLIIENSVSPIRNEKGEIIGFRGVGRDITERLKMEETLAQSEKRYRTILEEMQEAYFEVDLAGNFTLFNDAQCRQLGYSREEMTGLSYKVITPPDQVKKVFEIYNRIYRTGEPNEMFQAEQIRKDGKRIPVEYSVFPIRNESGEIIGFRGVGRDITERVQMIEALKQSEERYRTVLEEMEDPYYEMDLAGRFTFFNNALCRRLGYSKEELMGMHYKVYTPPEDCKTVFEQFSKVYRTGEPAKLLLRSSIKKDGTRNFSETSALPIRNERGEIIGFRGITRDLTERKKAEEERKQLEQKAQFASRLASVGELASGVAHEINNPLTGVIGYAHLLLARKDISRDVRRDLEIINEGAQRVAGIVKKLLTFARQAKPEQRYVDINELIRNTLDLRAYELAASNIKVSLQLTRDMPMTIADPGQLQQVFLNLVINAETEMKLAYDRGRLSIKTEKVKSTLRITFKDTGPGIARENLETIFDPFFTTREVGQGTGLGLSVCHGIVTEHKGRIWAESEPGKGAAFIVELPITTEEKQLELAEPVVAEPQKITKAKILIVDDEPVIRQFISQVLGEQGHAIETVDNAADALVKVKSKRYRLILLDIKMPGMSGIELYKRFQKIAPSLTKRVVFITGDVMGKRTLAFIDKTKTPYMMKPFNARELKTQINRILARK
jgi:PAS domain S-box-containing protein